MLNTMYFTSLVPQMEGVRAGRYNCASEMAPELLEELDALYNIPAGDPGMMGTFGDNLFGAPRASGPTSTASLVLRPINATG